MFILNYDLLNNKNIYNNFIDICFQFCDSFSLNANENFEDEESIWNLEQFYLTSLSNNEFQLEKVIYSPFNNILMFQLDKQARIFLLQAGVLDNFNFQNGFEDLCFYRNGNLCFRSISHEKIAFWEDNDLSIISKLKKIHLL